MTVKDIFELRKQGRFEEAYAAIRQLYAQDRGPYTTLAMFWTATDILKLRLNEGRQDEAAKILLALERILPSVPDKEGWVQNAFEKCQRLMQRGVTGDRQHDKRPDHLLTGAWGEELAADYLRENGYAILERDWHSGHRDIDIIACKAGLTVFVEVKTRRNRAFGDPAAAVDQRKQHDLLRAINHYRRFHRLDAPHRFDVITVVGTPGCAHPEIEHLEDFQLAEPRYSGGHRWG